MSLRQRLVQSPAQDKAVLAPPMTGHALVTMSTSPPPLIVICAVGLSPEHIGSATPCLSALASQGSLRPLSPSLPAVTTTGQTTMLTGVDPSSHGIVANGWYFRDLSEIWLWRQSESLIQAPLVWQGLQRDGRPLRVLKHFWWYAMNTTADSTVTPRPVYHHDGRKSPDIYASPPSLKERLIAKHGTFPLFNFWGPVADIRSSRWIAESFTTAYDYADHDLALVYLPHLDYDLQRHGPQGAHLEGNLRDLDACVALISNHAQARGARVMVVSEYGIEAVDHGIYINRALRQRGLLSVTTNAAGELLDPGTSRAFALCDHQLAHVYVRRNDDVETVAQQLRGIDGIEGVYCGDQRAAIGLDHPRSGEIVCLAAAGTWFAYDYWLDDRLKPDFAHCVEIHKKPGYDPRELFFDPRGGKGRALRALIKKKLGLRYLLNPVPLDDTLVRGSHGRLPSRPESGPLLIAPAGIEVPANPQQRDIAGIIGTLLTQT